MLIVLCLPGLAWGQNSQPCRQALKKKQFEQAIGCFQKLYQAHPDKLGYLRNQAIIYRMWSQSLKSTKPARACHLLQQSIQRYGTYRTKVTGVNRLEVAARISRLQKQLGLASLSISAIPAQTSVMLVGYKYFKKAQTPYIFTHLCPGRYTLRLDHKEHFPTQLQLTIQPNETLAKTYRLKPRNPVVKDNCPLLIKTKLGKAGCGMWRQCLNKDMTSCVTIGNYFSRQDDILNTVFYLGRACRLGHSLSCFRAGEYLEANKNIKRARKLYAMGCRAKHPRSCYRLGELYALRREKQMHGYVEGGKVKRQCKRAIAFYHRACKYGYRKACGATCNETSMLTPILTHSILHVGGIIGGVTLGATNSFGSQLQTSASVILGFGALNLLITATSIPIWYHTLNRQSLAWMILGTLTNLYPLAAGLISIMSDLSNMTEGFRFGLSALFFALPVQILWTTFAWMRFNHHKRIASRADKDPNYGYQEKDEPTKTSSVQIYWSPTVLQGGMGIAIGGVF